MKINNVYVVHFKGFEYEDKSKLKLTFVSTEKKISGKNYSDFLENLKGVSSKVKNVHIVRNIDSVKIVESLQLNYKIQSYVVLLFCSKEYGKKIGFLFGEDKKLGSFILGIWPYNVLNNYTDKEIESFLLKIIKNPELFDDIMVIH